MNASERNLLSDDRERTAASLCDHYAAGRLTGDEFNERLDRAYAATTLGELAGLMTDLPAPTDPGQLPDPSQLSGPAMAAPGRFPTPWRAA